MSSAFTAQFLLGTVRLSVGVLILSLVVAGCGQESSEAEVEPDTSTVHVKTPSMTVNEVIRTDSRFSTLVASLDSTGLDTTLSGEGPFTLLAPPDSAFDALPDGTVPLLMSERPDRLRTIIAHHIIDGRLDATKTADSTVVLTLRGDTLRVRSTDSTLSVGGANVLDGVTVGNGVIHVVDRVLRPPTSD